MDYLDPRKRARHTIMLYVGYVLIGIGIAMATVVLVYRAYGFGIDRQGTVIQNGLVFVSSQPQAADIYVNGQLKKPKTNTRLVMTADTYSLTLKKAGYQDWSRLISVSGGEVGRFDYPLLIPNNLVTNSLASYPTAPNFMTQSPDKRWLILAKADVFNSFDVYDLRSPTEDPTPITIPPDALAQPAGAQSWEVIEWADDNRHLLLQHRYDDTSEFILVNRENPVQSLNLTRKLGVNPSNLRFIDRKFDRYYVYDAPTQTLSRASLQTTALTPVLTEVISYRSHGEGTLLYATSRGASAGQIRVRLLTNDRTYTIRSLTANTPYLLDITQYDNTFYAVVGASSENKVYVYRDPVRQIGTDVFKLPVPLHILRTTQPTHVSFSSSTQFIMVQNDKQFAVYDIENDEGYTYTAVEPLDAPQPNATWMDGNRLSFVSNGKHTFFDYDYKNIRTLSAALPAFKPVFAPDFRYSYSLTADSAGVVTLSQTALRIPSEL